MFHRRWGHLFYLVVPEEYSPILINVNVMSGLIKSRLVNFIISRGVAQLVARHVRDTELIIMVSKT